MILTCMYTYIHMNERTLGISLSIYDVCLFIGANTICGRIKNSAEAC